MFDFNSSESAIFEGVESSILSGITQLTRTVTDLEAAQAGEIIDSPKSTPSINLTLNFIEVTAPFPVAQLP